MFRKLASILVGGWIVSQLALAQVTSGTISGVVRDSTAAVIPDAAVAVQDLDTGTSRVVTTDHQGRYQALSLPLGIYEIQASREGFQTQVRRGITLTVGREAVVNFELPVGAITQRVEVTGEAPLVETTSSSVSALVETQQIQDLPLNGRSFDELALLQPAVSVSKFQSRSFQTGMTNAISIRGARPEQNSWLLDGTDAMGPTNGIPGSVGGQSLGVDAVREFKVETTTFTAQYGRAAGGVVNVITKSGTNKFHGTAFEFLRNDNFDARNFFDRDPSNPTERSDPPEFKRNQFGGSLGGPIFRDRTFFFGSYESLRERLGQTLFANVPTAAARLGDLNGDGVPEVQVNPTSARYLEALYPLPNGRELGGGVAQLVQGFSRPTEEDYFTARVDHNFSTSDTLFGRYTFDDGERISAASYAFVKDRARSRNQYATFSETHIFSPALLNTMRVGFNRSHTALAPKVNIDEATLNPLAFIPGKPILLFGTTINIGGGVSGMGNANIPRTFSQNLYEWANDLTHTVGNHSIKGGVNVERLQFRWEDSLNAGGVIRFGSLRDFLQGTVQGIDFLKPGSAVGVRYFRWSYLGWYVQDDIRLHPRLTVNLGFRHELYTGPAEKFGNYCTLNNLMDTTFSCGRDVFPTSATSKSFAPRFGFAWDVFGTGTTSVRGGYGIFYDAISPLWWQASVSTQPPSFKLSLERPSWPIAVDLARAVQQALLSPTPTRFTATPSTQQFSLTIQQQLTPRTVFSVGYVGSLGRHLWIKGNENTKVPTILPDGRKCFNFLEANGSPNPNCPNGALQVRNPLFDRIRFVRTEGNSTYNGMIVNLQRRFSGALQFQASYTLSKSIDTGSNITGTFSNNTLGTNLVDAFDWTLDRSLSDFDTRHNLNINGQWNVPFPSGFTGTVGRILGGWQMGGILKVASASPLTADSSSANWSANGSTSSALQERPNVKPGRDNNPVLADPNRWFDPTAFEIQERGFYGNLGRNTISGPDQVTFDFSLMKNFVLSKTNEEFRLQFRAEFFNLFNRANFGGPDLRVFDARGNMSSTAGLISETATSARQVQLALKLYF